METKRYSLQEIDNLLIFLLHNAKSTSNANKAGEESKSTAIEDGVTLDTINGISIQYSVEYDIDLIYIFKKSGNRNRGYSYRIKEGELDAWEKLRREARYRFKKSTNLEQIISGEIKYRFSDIEDEAEKEEYPIEDDDAWTLQGQCLQYFNRDCNLSINERIVLSVLLDRSFALKKRWCYLGYSDFPITNDSSLKKTLDSLVDKKLISYKNTFKDGKKALNEYRILEPKVYIDNFDFIN